MAASPKLLSSFDNALESFKLKSGLTPKDLQDMEVTTLLDLQKTIANIQKRQQGSKKMMYLKRLQPFLNAMEQYTQVINIFVNTSDIAAFVWVGSPFCLHPQSVLKSLGPDEISSHCKRLVKSSSLCPFVTVLYQRSLQMFQKPLTPYWKATCLSANKFPCWCSIGSSSKAIST